MSLHHLSSGKQRNVKENKDRKMHNPCSPFAWQPKALKKKHYPGSSILVLFLMCTGKKVSKMIKCKLSKKINLISFKFSLGFYCRFYRRQLAKDYCNSSAFPFLFLAGDHFPFLFWKLLPELRAELCGASRNLSLKATLLWKLFLQIHAI